MQRTVICIEDDPFMQDLYTSLLTDRGYLVHTCGTGEVAKTLLDDTIAHFIIIDMLLPDTDGLALADYLRKQPHTANVPFMFISNDESERKIVAGLELGAVDYIVKPFHPSELVAKVGAILGRNGHAHVTGFGAGNQYFAGRYDILRQLGRGGSSTVMQARDMAMPEPEIVALKIYAADFYNGCPVEHVMARFLREAYQLAKLQHPHIVALKDFGKCPSGRFYLAMEYVGGETLHDLLIAYGVLPDAEVAGIGFQISEVLSYFTGRNLIHRDLSPRNIVINDAGFVKLIDFGLAKSYRDHLLAEEGMILGTPIFMAPELLEQPATADSRADIYSLGVTLYVSLCPDLPYHGTPTQIVEQRRTCRLPPLAQAMPHVNRQLAELVDRMVAEAPAARPQLPEIQSCLRELMNP